MTSYRTRFILDPLPGSLPDDPLPCAPGTLAPAPPAPKFFGERESPPEIADPEKPPVVPAPLTPPMGVQLERCPDIAAAGPPLAASVPPDTPGLLIPLDPLKLPSPPRVAPPDPPSKSVKLVLPISLKTPGCGSLTARAKYRKAWLIRPSSASGNLPSAGGAGGV